MSLRWRISIALSTLAMGAAAIAAIGSYLATADQLRSSFDRSLSERAAELGTGPKLDASQRVGRSEMGISGRCPPTGLIEPASAAQVVEPSGAITVCIPGGSTLPAPASPATGAVALSETTVDGRVLRIATAPFHDGGTIQVARYPSEYLGVLGVLRTKLIALAVTVSLIAGFLGWFMARHLVRPLVRLRDAARSIAKTGDLTTSLVVDGSGETRDLAMSFDEMVHSLAALQEQQHRLVSDASHEMRTPLTSLTTNLDLLDRFDELPIDDRPEVVAAVRCDVEELTYLMTELVELATDRSNDEPIQMIELSELVAGVADRCRRRSGRKILVVVSGEGFVAARPVMIERAVSNLVDNATKYSPASSPIELRVGRHTVEVADRGPAVPADLTERIFERFFRTPEARSHPGSGLGLAIVQQVVERHQGITWARRRDGGGLEIGFELPNKPEENLSALSDRELG